MSHHSSLNMAENNKFLRIFTFFLLIFLPEQISGKNILFFHSFVTSSHRTAIWPLADALANKGHNVTYIFPCTKRIGSNPKITELIPSKMIPILENFVSDFDINIRLENRVNEWLEQVLGISFDLCKAFYSSPEIIEWMEKPGLDFDLIFVDGSLGECGYGLQWKWKSKMILFAPIIPPFLFDGLGIVPESSSLPDVLFHPKPNQMGFINRVMSTLTPLLWRYKFTEYIENLRPVISEGLNITDLPHLQEIEANTSLVMINQYLIEDYPRALPPMFVSYSGLWCSKAMMKERKELPKEIKKFIGDSDFFYVSFGSATVASAMPLEMRNSFFEAFRKLPIKFLWRWTGPVPEDKPENALLLPWFPQHDILAHDRLKGFMMQAGRPSSQEALCHGVPLITVPIFGDQDYNADRLEQVGAALVLDIGNITVDSIVENFRELLENPKYKRRMKELQEQFMDRPLDPLDNALYWTEYVLRRDTSILRPLEISQKWWERRLLDVYAFLALVLAAIFVTIAIILKIGLTLILNRFNGSQKIKSD